MSYNISNIRTIENYRDRNFREKHEGKETSARGLTFPFLRMEQGQYFELTIKPSEHDSVRVMLHQSARLAQIWIKTSVITRNKDEVVIRVIHDGKRN